MKTHGHQANLKYAQSATTSTPRVRTVDELRMTLADKARGQRIAELRKRKRLTQQAMAERLQIAYRTYQTWEAGTVMPEWENLEKLALFHQLRVEDIIGDDMEAAPPSLGDQLDRIEANQDRILGELAAIRLALASPTRRKSRSQSPSQGRTKATGS